VKRIEKQIEQVIEEEKRRRKIFEASLTVRVFICAELSACLLMSRASRSFPHFLVPCIFLRLPTHSQALEKRLKTAKEKQVAAIQKKLDALKNTPTSFSVE